MRPPSSASGSTTVLGPGVSFDAYVHATALDPQPGWRTLQAIAEAAFTGEVRFASVPAYAAYADHGTIYAAERLDAAPIGRRLVESGMITVEQLDRGAVLVADHVHIGRMFDRDSSVNRAGVIAHVNETTNAVLAEIGALPAASATCRPYHHHPAGLHHWFAGRVHVPAADPRQDPENTPGPGVAPPIGPPGPPAAPTRAAAPTPAPDGSDGLDREPGIRIEWHNVQLSTPSSPPTRERRGVTDDPVSHTAATGDIPVAGAGIGTFDADRADWGPGFERYIGPADVEPADTVEAPTVDDVSSATHVDIDDINPFHITWPDGTRETTRPDALPTSGPITVDDHTPAGPSTVADTPPTDLDTTSTTDVAADPSTTKADEAPVGSGGTAGPIVDEPQADDATPHADEPDSDEVADAVRRVLQTIEDAAEGGMPLPRQIVIPPPPRPPTDVVIETAPSANGFAPPTADMHADAVYARAVEAKVWHDTSTTEMHPDVETAAGSVGAGDRTETGAGNERRGALRRLIASLRRHD